MLTSTVLNSGRDRSSVPHPWFYPAEPPVIVAIGDWTQTAVGILLQAFSQVRSIHLSNLMLLGELPRRDRVMAWLEQQHLEDCTALTGVINHPSNYIENADLGIEFSHPHCHPQFTVSANNTTNTNPQRLIVSIHAGQLTAAIVTLLNRPYLQGLHDRRVATLARIGLNPTEIEYCAPPTEDRA
jgi:hypothetical protein